MRKGSLLLLAVLGTTSTARAEDPRVHATAGASRAVGGPQGSELGPGGSGGAALELPVTRALGVQASGGVLVLSKADAPSDPSLAARTTGTAFTATAGVRFHPLPIAGLWLDGNGGVAATGSALRPAFDAHLGWDFRLARTSRWDVGPFVGYTQVVEPDSSLRPEDARILTVGVQIGLGAREPERAAPPPAVEPPPPIPEPVVAAAQEEAVPDCPEGTVRADDGGCVTQTKIEIVDDRIVLDDIIHFDFNSPRIRTSSRGLVREVAKFIASHTEIVDVSIEGHADARGTVEYNQHLSESRAESTRAMLVEFGVEPSRLKVVGFGKSRLKVATPLAEPLNRRVEFIVSRHQEIVSPVAAVK